MFCILVILLYSTLGAGTLLKIHSADILKQNQIGGKTIYGNVDIEYDIYRVKCDSAVLNKDMTHARLFRNIQFSDTSRTIKCKNATLSKTPNGNMAYLMGDIRITEKDFYITGKEASMNEITDRVSVTDSVIVKYFKFPSALYCKQLELSTGEEIVSSESVDSVHYIDSLRYYKLFTRSFSYDIKKEKLVFETKFDLEAHEFSEPYMKFRQTDPAKIMSVVKKLKIVKDGYFSANRGTFIFDSVDIETVGKCSFRQYDREKADTLLFNSDRIIYSEKTQKGDASGNVMIRKDKMIIDTKHAAYYRQNDIVKFLDKPVVTYDNNTITGDSIELKIGKKDFYPETAVIYGNPVFRSEPKPDFPDEINILKGKLMNLWFSGKDISKIIVSKEAEGVYFIRRERSKTSEASNYLLGDEMVINFVDGKINNASIKGGCEGVYYPDKMKKEVLKPKKK